MEIKDLKNDLEAVKLRYELEGYVSTNTADFLIKTSFQLIDEVIHLNREVEKWKISEAVAVSLLKKYAQELMAFKEAEGGNFIMMKFYIEDVYFFNDKHGFDNAISFCEEHYGYEGEAWELVKASEDCEELIEFLEDDLALVGWVIE